MKITKKKTKKYDVIISPEEALKLRLTKEESDKLEKEGIRGKDYLIASIQHTIVISGSLENEKTDRLV